MSVDYIVVGAGTAGCVLAESIVGGWAQFGVFARSRPD